MHVVGVGVSPPSPPAVLTIISCSVYQVIKHLGIVF